MPAKKQSYADLEINFVRLFTEHERLQQSHTALQQKHARLRDKYLALLVRRGGAPRPSTNLETHI
jgi:hypothetical protein